MHAPRITHFAFAASMLGLGCLLLIGCSKDDGKSSSTSSSDGSSHSSGPKVSKGNFDKVKDGMTEKDVADTLGPPSASAEFDAKALKDMMKSAGSGFNIEIPEIPGVAMPKMTLKNWEDGDTLYQVVFQEDKVVSKDSASKKAKVTKENADRIKAGMSRAEVEAILGKGKVDAGAKIQGFEGSVTVWEGPDGAISVIFTDDKVTATGGWQKK